MTYNMRMRPAQGEDIAPAQQQQQANTSSSTGGPLANQQPGGQNAGASAGALRGAHTWLRCFCRLLNDDCFALGAAPHVAVSPVHQFEPVLLEKPIILALP